MLLVFANFLVFWVWCFLQTVWAGVWFSSGFFIGFGLFFCNLLWFCLVLRTFGRVSIPLALLFLALEGGYAIGLFCLGFWKAYPSVSFLLLFGHYFSTSRWVL